MQVKVFNKEGQDTGREVTLSDEIFGIEPNDHVLYLAVKQYLAHQRQGTHKAKERGEVKGSRKKIKKQKGTGTARAGDIKNPLFRGGGRVFGPRPRKYTIKLNDKVKVLANKSALTYKAKEENILVVEDFNFETPKTKEFVNIMKGFETNGKTLMITGNEAENVYLSARNLPKVNVTTADLVNTYELMNCSKLILTETAVKSIEERLQ